MKWVRNLICLVLSAALLFGCVGCEKEEAIHDTTPMSYVKTEVDVSGFVPATSMLYEDGTIYSCGVDSNESPALLTYSVDTGEYEITPLGCDGEPEQIALCDDGIAYISRRDGDSTALATLYLPDGGAMQLAEIIPALVGTWYQVNMISCGGSLYITGSNNCVELDTSGNIIERYTFDGQIYRLVKLSDDEFCFTLQDNDGNTVYISDGGKPKISDELTTLLNGSGITNIVHATDNELILRVNDGLSACDLADFSRRAILDWVLTGFAPSNVGGILYISDELMFVSAKDVIDDVRSIWRLTPGEADTSDRIEIKVTYFDDGSGMVANAVVLFNVLQDEYYAIADDLNDKTGEESVLDKFDRAFLTGEIGDVIIFSNTDDIDKYIEQKALVDLYSLMDNDENFSRDLLLDCAYLPYEIDGSLFYLPRQFHIFTLAGKTANFPDGITVYDFIELAESGATPLADMSKNNVERILLFAGIGDFIDSDNKTCDFTSDEFIRLLEFLKSLDTTSEIIYDDKDAVPYINDEYLLYETHIGPMVSYMKSCALFGYEDISIVGYPSNTAGASELIPENILTVSAQSDKTDGAWGFVKFMLSGASFDNSDEYIPALKSALWDNTDTESVLRFLFAPNSAEYRVYVDPNEEIHEDSGTIMRINEELVADFEQFIADIRIPTATEAKVREIISEELDAYYAGAKSAAETAEVIQNRVQLYLNE